MCIYFTAYNLPVRGHANWIENEPPFAKYAFPNICSAKHLQICQTNYQTMESLETVVALISPSNNNNNNDNHHHHQF